MRPYCKLLSKRVAILVLYSVIWGSALYGAEASLDEGKLLVARHLLAIKADDPLTWIRNESYWQTVFAAKKKSSLFPKFWPGLRQTLLDVPLMRGKQVSGSNILIQALMGSLRPLPMVPLSELPFSERQKIRSFANGPLTRLSKETHNPEAELSDAIADVAFEAARIFKSPVMLERVQSFTDVLPTFRLDGKEIDVIDQAERLNELLHMYGLHLVVSPEALDEGMVMLSVYKIEERFNVNVAGQTLSMALVDPVFEPGPYSVLGHAEEGDVMLLFKNRIERHASDMKLFIEGAASVLLLVDPEINSVMSTGGLTAEESTFLENRVRARALEVLGSSGSVQSIQKATMLSVAQHEGYHKIIENQLDEARRDGKVSWNDVPVWSEEGSYLYQLEVADPAFVVLDLFVVIATALQGHSDFDANRTGARRALMKLQEEIPHIQFWSNQNEPIPAGLEQLFQMSMEDLRPAAAKARQQFEQQL